MSHRQGQHGDIVAVQHSCRCFRRVTGVGFVCGGTCCGVASQRQSVCREDAKRQGVPAMSATRIDVIDAQFQHQAASIFVARVSPTARPGGTVTASPGVPPSVVHGDRDCFDTVPTHFSPRKSLFPAPGLANRFRECCHAHRHLAVVAAIDWSGLHVRNRCLCLRWAIPGLAVGETRTTRLHCSWPRVGISAVK